MQISTIAPRLVSRGVDVTVLSMGTPGPLVERLAAHGVPVVQAGLEHRRLSKRAPLDFARVSARMALMLRRLRPDIVHSHMVPANLVSRLVRPFADVPILICTAHSVFEGGWWKRMAYRATDRLCDVTTNVCESGARQAVADGRVPRARIISVPNGVDTGLFRASTEVRTAVRRELCIGDQFVWLAAGRLVQEKNWSLMLRSFAELWKRGSASRLLIAGDGPLRTEVEHLRATLQIGHRVRLLGMHPDVARLMKASDAFVLSSTVEGLPMVLLEASSAALPIVATAVGGVTEVVVDGVTGFVARPNDARALSSALEGMEALRPSERDMLGKMGRERTQRLYDIESVCDRWMQIYRDLLQRKGLGVRTTRFGLTRSPGHHR